MSYSENYNKVLTELTLSLGFFTRNYFDFVWSYGDNKIRKTREGSDIMYGGYETEIDLLSQLFIDSLTGGGIELGSGDIHLTSEWINHKHNLSQIDCGEWLDRLSDFCWWDISEDIGEMFEKEIEGDFTEQKGKCVRNNEWEGYFFYTNNMC